MSDRKKVPRSKTHKTGKPSAPKSASKSGSRVTPQRRKAGEALPDLTAIFYAFCDARALVTVAHAVIVESDDYGPEESVLRLGVEALNSVSDQLDEAEMQLDRFRTKNASAQGGV
jgi:hypothetical protein